MCMVNIGNRISTLENEFQFLELLQFYSLSDVGCSSFSLSFSEMDILSQNIIIMMIHQSSASESNFDTNLPICRSYHFRH